MDTHPIQQKVVGDNNTFTAAGDVHVHYELPPSEGEDRRNLLTLLDRVRRFWIQDRLEGFKHSVALMPLYKKTLPEAVEHPWKALLSASDLASREIPLDKDIHQVFGEAGRLLLILGAVGSGKTTTLLELARGLAVAAEADPAQPVPVVFHLSSWANRRKPMLDWLVDELRTKYTIPPRLGRPFLTRNRLLPLLDGLDEVPAAHRSACVDALNRFIGEVGVPGLVVCSRFDEYNELSLLLKVQGAVHLQPLTPEHVQKYVAAEGPRLASLLTLLREDAVLLDLARSPLMLEVMGSAYGDLPVEALRDARLDSAESRREHVLHNYVERMFERRGGDRRPYTREQTLRWISWLARNMIHSSQNIFLIERLQPTWLSDRGGLTTYLLGSRVAAGLTLALTLSLSSMLGGFKSTGQRFGELFSYLLLGTAMGVFTSLLKLRRLRRRKDGDTPSRRLLAAHVLSHMAFAGVVGALVGCFMGWVWLMYNAGAEDFDRQEDSVGTLWHELLTVPDGHPPLWAKALIFMVAMALAGFLAGLIHGLLYGLIVGVRDRRRAFIDDIQTAEMMSWSKERAKRAVRWVASRGLVVGIIGGIILSLFLNGYGLYMAVSYPELGRIKTLSDLHFAVGFGFLVSIAMSLLIALIISFYAAILSALIGGLNTSRIVETNDLTNFGIRRSIKNSLRAAAIVGIVLGLVDLTGNVVAQELTKAGVPSLWPAPQRSWRELAFSAIGWFAGYGMMAALWYGGFDIIKHYALRLILYKKGHAPRRFDTFLEYAAGLGFMHKVGGGYIFFHSLLREHFAGLGTRRGGTSPRQFDAN